MTPTKIEMNDAEKGMIREVVSRFLADRKPTQRRVLVHQFKEPGLLDRLVNCSVLREINREMYYPLALAFYLNGDASILGEIKQSIEMVLRAIQHLFSTDLNKTQLLASEIEAQVGEMYGAVKPSSVWLGLYFAQELSVLGGLSMNTEQTQINAVSYSDRIIVANNLEGLWDELIKSRLHYFLRRDKPNASLDTFRFEEGDVLVADSPQAEASSQMLIFISHSSKDAGIAFTLIELLMAALRLSDEQIRCTSVDRFRLPAGANTDDILKSEVRDAKAFIGLISPSSLASAYVLFELGARWGSGLHMVPVLAGVSAESMQGPLKNFNAITASNLAQLCQLVGEIGKRLQIHPQEPASYTPYALKLMQQVQDMGSAPQTRSTVSAESINQPRRDFGLRSLTRESVIATAKDFAADKRAAKWNVRVEGKLYPVRPLSFKAAGLLPNDPATTHDAVAILKKLGFEVFYEGNPA